MGIGNEVLERGVTFHRPVLITPHGDWKHVVHQPRFGIALLITPHGDWKPSGAAVATSAAAGSLPLMGIGNLVAISLVTLDDVRSLPLMGIGNSGRCASILRDLPLITPHGDWKPAPAG